jgi:hypothetical protein
MRSGLFQRNTRTSTVSLHHLHISIQGMRIMKKMRTLKMMTVIGNTREGLRKNREIKASCSLLALANLWLERVRCWRWVGF